MRWHVEHRHLIDPSGTERCWSIKYCSECHFEGDAIPEMGAETETGSAQMVRILFQSMIQSMICMIRLTSSRQS